MATYRFEVFRFQISLEEMRSTADEGARLANLCSTRMGRAQQVLHFSNICKQRNPFQMCLERAESVMEIDTFLRNTTELENKIKDLNRKVDKLVRFCNQTEQAMTHLEALNVVAKSEEEVNLIRQQAKSAMTIINMDAGPTTLAGETCLPESSTS